MTDSSCSAVYLSLSNQIDKGDNGFGPKKPTLAMFPTTLSGIRIQIRKFIKNQISLSIVLLVYKLDKRNQRTLHDPHKDIGAHMARTPYKLCPPYRIHIVQWAQIRFLG